MNLIYFDARCLPLAIGCYRYILVVHPSLVMGKPTLLRLVIKMIFDDIWQIRMTCGMVWLHWLQHYDDCDFLFLRSSHDDVALQERILLWLLFLLPMAGRYSDDDDGGGCFYDDDDDDPSHGRQRRQPSLHQLRSKISGLHDRRVAGMISSWLSPSSLL